METQIPTPSNSPVLERQPGVGVEVLDHEGVETLVAPQLHLVHAEPDHPPVLDLGREVADPTAHKVQDLAAGREMLCCIAA